MACPGPGERETRTPIKGVRKFTAAAMVASAFTAPHVTEFLTVDVTPTMELLARLKASRAFAGYKLTPLTFVSKAVLIALRNHPTLNARWDEANQEIVQFNTRRRAAGESTPSCGQRLVWWMGPRNRSRPGISGAFGDHRQPVAMMRNWVSIVSPGLVSTVQRWAPSSYVAAVTRVPNGMSRRRS